METADIINSARNQLSRILETRKGLKRLEAAHRHTLIQVLRRSQAKELDNVREDGERRVAAKELGIASGANWVYPPMADGLNLIPSEPAEVRVMAIRVERAGAYGLHGVYIEKTKVLEMVTYWAQEGKGLLWTPDEFRSVIGRLQQTIALSEDENYLCGDAGEHLYNEAIRMGNDFLKRKYEREHKPKKPPPPLGTVVRDPSGATMTLRTRGFLAEYDADESDSSESRKS